MLCGYVFERHICIFEQQPQRSAANRRCGFPQRLNLPRAVPDCTKLYTGLCITLQASLVLPKLTRKPCEYRVGEILCAAEGELAPVACLAKDGKKCERGDSCYTLPFWRGLEEQINAYVNSYTLQDLLDLKTRKNNECCGCGCEEGEENK